MSNAIHEALTMPGNVRRENFEKQSRYVKKHNGELVGAELCEDLKRIKVEDGMESPGAGSSLSSRP